LPFYSFFPPDYNFITSISLKNQPLVFCGEDKKMLKNPSVKYESVKFKCGIKKEKKN